LSASTADTSRLTMGGSGPASKNVTDLYKGAWDGSTINREHLVMAHLLRQYKDVFSSREHDVVLTKALQNEIP